MIFFVNFIFTWVVGLLVPLLARFAIVKKPLSPGVATGLAVANSVVFWLLFTILSILAGTRDPSYGIVWVLVYFVARMILLSGGESDNDMEVMQCDWQPPKPADQRDDWQPPKPADRRDDWQPPKPADQRGRQAGGHTIKIYNCLECGVETIGTISRDGKKWVLCEACYYRISKSLEQYREVE